MTCRICGSEREPAVHHAREMMIGLRDLHAYLECADCGCLQIERIPDDIARYYDGGYYSFSPPAARGAKQWLVDRRNRYAALRRGLLGRLLQARNPTRQFDFLGPVLASLNDDTRVLDVGCGAGALIRSLRGAGMRNVLGADPFIAADIEYRGAPLVRKARLDELPGPFDLIMFHHSFEHLPEQAGTLRAVAARLAPGGWCIVRVPLASSHAWRHYGVDWVQLDAPRHFYLHTAKSFTLLAERAGFECTRVVHDSTAFQFWGSEQYARGITLRDARSWAVNPAASMFGAADIARFEQEAARLNAAGDGDQAAFYLRLRTPARPASSPA